MNERMIRFYPEQRRKRRLAAYGLRPAKQGGSVLLRKAAVLTEHSYAGDKGNMPLQKG